MSSDSSPYLVIGHSCTQSLTFLIRPTLHQVEPLGKVCNVVAQGAGNVHEDDLEDDEGGQGTEVGLLGVKTVQADSRKVATQNTPSEFLDQLEEKSECCYDNILTKKLGI